MSNTLIRKFAVLFGLILSALLSSDQTRISAKNSRFNIRYQITTVSERGAEREILSQTTIEGLPGTDFKINLDTGNFKLEARFVNDLIAESRLRMRAHLTTRRFYGYSPINLPLYEEDAQSKNLDTDFNEAIILFPFGKSGENNAEETLKIEIVPTLQAIPDKTQSSKLTINFDKPIPSGEISIEAVQLPHHFNVEALLETDGHVVARGANNFSLEEKDEIVLLPEPGATFGRSAAAPFKAKLSVDKIIKNRPQDLAGITFDFYQPSDTNSKPERKIISHGAGIGSLGGELSYPLENFGDANGKNYQLKFKIRVVDKEK